MCAKIIEECEIYHGKTVAAITGNYKQWMALLTCTSMIRVCLRVFLFWLFICDKCRIIDGGRKFVHLPS